MGAVGEFFFALTLVLATTIACILVLRPLATRTGWVDSPSARKRHTGDIPLIGGISIVVGMAVGVLYGARWMSDFGLALFATAAAVAVIGAIDDRFDLSVRFRVLAQLLIILVMVQVTGVRVDTLGMFMGHDFALGWMAVPFTVIAVGGLANAFNMVDGLDGLCGTLGMVSIAFVSLVLGAGTWTDALAAMMLAGLAPYLAFNLGLFGKRHKIFMGDAGSQTLGYVVAWSLIYASQGATQRILPATVLWFVAIPALDALTVMSSRLLDGRSPLSAGQSHIHHILLRKGLGPRQTLLVLAAAGIGLALAGVALERAGPSWSLGTFLALGLTYALIRIATLKAAGDKIAASKASDTPSAVPPTMAGERDMA